MKKLVGIRLDEELWNLARKKVVDLDICFSGLVGKALKEFCRRGRNEV